MEGCEVSFGDASDDADPVEFYDERIVTARKAHICDECGGPIAKGERYERKSYRVEGEFCTDHICDACHEVAGEFEHCLVGGMLWQQFEAEWDEGAHLQPCLNRLTSVRAKTTMRDQWMKWHDKRVAQRQRAIQRRNETR